MSLFLPDWLKLRLNRAPCRVGFRWPTPYVGDVNTILLQPTLLPVTETLLFGLKELRCRVLCRTLKLLPRDVVAIVKCSAIAPVIIHSSCCPRCKNGHRLRGMCAGGLLEVMCILLDVLRVDVNKGEGRFFSATCCETRLDDYTLARRVY